MKLHHVHHLVKSLSRSSIGNLCAGLISSLVVAVGIFVTTTADAKPVLSSNSTQNDAQFAPAPQTISNNKGVYIEANVGGARTRYTSLYPYTHWDDGNWQFALGGDGGYRFDNYLAAELGYDYYTRAKGESSGGTVLFNQMSFYAAAKLIVPIYTGIEGFAKFGLSYAKLNIKGNAGAYAMHPSHWGPVFGVGVQYAFNDSFSIATSYMRYSGLSLAAGNTKTYMPPLNVIGLSFGYHFG